MSLATKHITQTIDDLDGTFREDAENVTFSVDGRTYEIDLSVDNVQLLRDAFEPYVSAGRTVTNSTRGSISRSRSSSYRHDPAAVRAWAKDNGYTVSPRGRIHVQVIEAYDTVS